MSDCLLSISLAVKSILGWDYFDPFQASIEELYNLYILVTEQLGQQTIIIDAGDLLRNPGQF